jgi:hypothetical protein
MHGKSRPRATATTATIAVTASTPMSMRERYAYVLKQNIGNSSTRLLRSSRLDKAMMLLGAKSPRRNSSKGGDDSMNASTLKFSGDRDLRIGRIYFTGMIAAVPVAVAAIFAASPTAAPAQLSLDAAGQSAVLLKVAPPPAPCRWPGGGDSPRSVCPGSNQKDTTRSTGGGTMTGSTGGNTGGGTMTGNTGGGTMTGSTGGGTMTGSTGGNTGGGTMTGSTGDSTGG